MIRNIHVSQIRQAVADLFLSANTALPESVIRLLEKGKADERSPQAISVFDDILENALIARCDNVAICQDTGVACVFAEIGQDVHIVGGNFLDAVNAGVKEAYVTGYFRASVVEDPLFSRVNTKDNTPAIVHVDIVPGDRIRLHALPKGTGSENMSALRMLVPADGAEGVKRFVLETVERAGPNPCPPLIVGVGVGGMMDYAALLAKKALLRKAGTAAADPATAEFEEQLLNEINALGIGAGGLGGVVTALMVHVETAPTHIGALPVAVNLQCHAARHTQCVL